MLSKTFGDTLYILNGQTRFFHCKLQSRENPDCLLHTSCIREIQLDNDKLVTQVDVLHFNNFFGDRGNCIPYGL